MNISNQYAKLLSESVRRWTSIKAAAIISEYNPFHNGHKYHIEQTRAKGATHIVAVMSGNYVQRCEPAHIDKRLRAKMALVSGVDLVVELPLPWATASAERFAKGAVQIINAIPAVELLSFGSESGDVERLSKAADVLFDEEVEQEILRKLESGVSYPAAREKSVEKIAGAEVASVFRTPNDILGIEYIKAIKSTGSRLKPMPIERRGAKHDGESLEDGFMSASEIRRLILSTLNPMSVLDYRNIQQRLAEFLPKISIEILNAHILSGDAPCSLSQLETAVLYALRRLSPEDYLNFPDVSEGLHNRIYSAVNSSVSLEEIYTKAKTKRYTLSRIRRIILSAFLGIEKDLALNEPPYIRVLGFNERGREILREVRKTAGKPIIMRYRDIKKCDDFAKRVFNLEAASSDIYALAKPTKAVAGSEYTDNIVLV